MKHYSLCRMHSALLVLFSVCIGIATSSPSGVCVRSRSYTRRLIFTTTRYQSRVSHVPCGSLFWRRCRVYRQERYIAFLSAYRVAYTTEQYCCLGYEGSPQGTCRPACRPPCQNYGQCVRPNQCACTAEWEGDRCNEPICRGSCQNGGTCISPGNCVCTAHWRGGNCGIPVCTPLCRNGGACVAPGICSCLHGWSGGHCEEAVCNPPCYNGGMCMAPQTCHCSPGWSGPTCEQDINECDNSMTCEQNCTNTDGSYSCTCNTGYTLTYDLHGCLAPPQNVFLNITGSRSCWIHWDSPPLDQSDGSLRVYILSCSTPSHYRAIPQRSISSFSHQYQLNNLKPFTNYTCCVAAETTKGLSLYLCDTNKTLQDIPGDSPQMTNVTNTSASTMLIKWNPPLMPNGVIIAYTMYIIYDNGSKVELSVNGSSRRYFLESLSPYELVYVQISASTIAGEGPTSPTYNRTGQAVPSTVTDMRVTPQSLHQIHVSWQPPNTPSGIIAGYKVKVYNERYNYSHNVSFSHYVWSTTISHNIEPFIPYTVEVRAYTHAGEGAIEKQTMFTLEGAPKEAPLITNLFRNNASNAYLSWEALTLEELRGFLDTYEVVYHETNQHICPYTEPEFRHTQSVTTNSAIITALDPEVEYCVGVAASTVAGVGNYSHKLLPSFASVLLQVPFHGDINCLDADISIFQEIFNTLSLKFCDCHIPTCHIETPRVVCNSNIPKIIIFEGEIVSVDGRNVSEVMECLVKWVSTAPHIVAEGVQLIADIACAVELPNLEECAKTSDVKETTQFPITPVVAAVSIIVLLAALVVLTTCGVAVRWQKSRKVHSTSLTLHVNDDSVDYATVGTVKESKTPHPVENREDPYTPMPTREEPTSYAVGFQPPASQPGGKASVKKREVLPAPTPVDIEPVANSISLKPASEEYKNCLPAKKKPAVPPRKPYKPKPQNGVKQHISKQSATVHAEEDVSSLSAKNGRTLPSAVPMTVKPHDDEKPGNSSGLGTKYRVGDYESPLSTKKRPMPPPTMTYELKSHNDTSELSTTHCGGEEETKFSTKTRPMSPPPSKPYKMKPRKGTSGLGTTHRDGEDETQLSTNTGSAEPVYATLTQLPQDSQEKISSNIAYGVLQNNMLCDARD